MVKSVLFRFGQILSSLSVMFAAHHEKIFVPAFLGSLMITYLITSSLEKEIIVLEEVWKKSLILDREICTNPV